MRTQIIKNNTLVATLPLQGNLQIVRELMGKNEIHFDVEVPDVLLSPIGSHIVIKNKQYTVNTPPLKVEKLGDWIFRSMLTPPYWIKS
jgi:hypothetical protein